MFYVYVLQSCLSFAFYAGSTNDLKERLKLHNDGKVFSTKRYKPWKLVYYEAYTDEILARMREKKLKHHGNIWKQLKKRIINEMKNGAGFTLIEVLVVVGLIGVLVGGLLTIVDPRAQIGKANDAKRKSELTQLQRALETYYQDNGKYPNSTGAAGNYAISGSIGGWGGSWPSYMAKVPKDPTDPTRKYVYYIPASCSNNQCYYLYASLERASDPQACNNGGSVCTSIGSNGLVANVCGGVCNYGVTSSNVLVNP